MNLIKTTRCSRWRRTVLILSPLLYPRMNNLRSFQFLSKPFVIYFGWSFIMTLNVHHRSQEFCNTVTVLVTTHTRFISMSFLPHRNIQFLSVYNVQYYFRFHRHRKWYCTSGNNGYDIGMNTLFVRLNQNYKHTVW